MSEPTAPPGPTASRPDSTRTGPGRLLVAVYALFALSASARAGVQIATKFSHAPVAYVLSAFAAVVYILATVTLANGSPTARRIALVSCSVELAGVLAVGTWSIADPAMFPDATVWSSYGSGYGFVPLVLPVFGLLWLRRWRRRARTRPEIVGTEDVTADSHNVLPVIPRLSWIGDERIAISGVPSARTVAGLADQGVTHVVNCRPRAQVWRSGDLAAERAAFGPERVAHAPMQDHGLRQRPAVWAAAACFAARVLDDEPQAGVLIHCTAGRRRSAMLTYAVLRLRGHDRAEAAALVLRYRTEAQLVPAYVRSVERWLASPGLR